MANRMSIWFVMMKMTPRKKPIASEDLYLLIMMVPIIERAISSKEVHTPAKAADVPPPAVSLNVLAATQATMKATKTNTYLKME
jgi:hypothetical protein